MDLALSRDGNRNGQRKRAITVSISRGLESDIRRMKSWVFVGIDSVCLFSTFALELEDKQGRERRKGKSWSYYTL